MGDFFQELVIGVIIALCSAFFAVRMSLARFRAEQWWQRKIETYTKIFESFHHLKAFSDKHLSAEMRGRDLPEDTDNALRAESKEAHKEIDKYTDIGAFIFSKEFHQRLKQYKADSAEVSNNNEGWVNYLIDDQEVTETCLNDLIILAKKDLESKKHNKSFKL